MPTSLGMCGGSEVPSTISQEQFGDLMKLNSHKSVELDDVYLKVLRELADDVAMFGSHCNQVMSSVTETRERLLPFLKRGERMNHKTSDRCASPPCLG